MQTEKSIITGHKMKLVRFQVEFKNIYRYIFEKKRTKNHFNDPIQIMNYYVQRNILSFIELISKKRLKKTPN